MGGVAGQEDAPGAVVLRPAGGVGEPRQPPRPARAEVVAPDLAEAVGELLQRQLSVRLPLLAEVEGGDAVVGVVQRHAEEQAALGTLHARRGLLPVGEDDVGQPAR